MRDSISDQAALGGCQKPETGSSVIPKDNIPHFAQAAVGEGKINKGE